MREMITEERFCRNMNLMHIAYLSRNLDIVLKIMRGFLAYFPNDKETLDHYCFGLDFGKCGEEFQTPEELYKQLTNTNQILVKH